MDNDIIGDILWRVADRLVLPDTSRELLRQIEHDARRDWGGDRIYIARHGEEARQEMTARNLAIIRDWQAGERVSCLARKYGISKQRVSRIVRTAV
jgi:Mor family transcriptional regulator